METFWKVLGRKKVFDSNFLKVYEEKVRLPSGKIVENYTVVEKPSVVMVVATDVNEGLLVLREYKHGVRKVLLTLPAGHTRENESVIEAAKREVEEEIGGTGGVFKEIGVLYDYPSKDSHAVFVVRAKDVVISKVPQRETTELISTYTFSIPEVKRQIQRGEWHASSALAALTMSGILFNKEQ